MAERVVGIPLTLIGGAVSQVIDAEVSRVIREKSGHLTNGYVRTSLALGGLGLISAAAFGLLGPIILPAVLGEEWQVAGELVQILAITSAIRLLASPLSKYILLLQAYLANIILDVSRIVLVATSIAAASILGLNFSAAAWLIYSALSATYLLTWIYGLFLVRARDNTP
tara:strand:+ start:7940 stop:8446 length:507 start_codon:yes stop_codon:yes gene_type:complete